MRAEGESAAPSARRISFTDLERIKKIIRAQIKQVGDPGHI